MSNLTSDEQREADYFMGVEVGMEVAPEVAEVERLRAEVERLRAAYGKAADAMAAFDKWWRDGCEYHPLLLDELQSRFADATVALAAVPAPQADDRLAVAERAAKAMRWECVKVAENYLTGKEARHIAGAMDLLDAPGIARRAVEEQEKKP